MVKDITAPMRAIRRNKDVQLHNTQKQNNEYYYYNNNKVNAENQGHNTIK